MDENKEVTEQEVGTKVETEEMVAEKDSIEEDKENEELLESEEKDEDELTEEEKEANSSEPLLVELLKRQDIKDFLKKVRQQEKSKLYEVMEKKNNKIKELTETIASLEDTIKTYKEGNDTTVSDLKVEIGELRKKVEKAEKAELEKSLELYRTKAIQRVRDSGLDLIDDLVKGNTEEEIDSAIKAAKAKYEEIVAKVSTKKGDKPVPKPIAPKQDAGARKLTTEEIAKMTPAEYAKHREEIKKGLY